MKKNTTIVIVGLVVIFIGIAIVWYFGFIPSTDKYAALVVKHPFAGLEMPKNLDAATRAERERVLQMTKAMYEKSPNVWDTWIAIGNLRQLFNDYDGAVQAYNQSIKLNNANIVAYRNLAEVYRTFLKDYKVAAGYYDLAIKNSLTDPDLYIQLADVQNKFLNDPSAAEKTYLLGLERTNGYADIYIHLARFYKARADNEKYDKYMAEFEKARAKLDGEKPVPTIPINVNVN